MGGGVTRPGQRIIPVGAAAGMVHPSTGYQICRTLSCNLDVADAIVKELGRGSDFDADLASARINDAVWTSEAIKQRNFALFGGDFLMKQKVGGLQGFFEGFFELPFPMWSGFLAGMKNLPNNDKHETWHARLLFGVTFLTKLPPRVGLSLVASILTYTLKDGTDLIQSVTPLFGDPDSYMDAMKFRDAKGDEQAKREAMEMCGRADRQEKVEVDATLPDKV
ncbi:hypothetical protein TrRE_jg6518 [Triparma retinervis]|uniref:Uncharacterized protein n=1 Tax=Triparma retinervis TaxID=2557542 RepID=A0A9W6Z945_9STRA|nr:hypothetical protein TrRE_jg6518 [Triparma retinervis]